MRHKLFRGVVRAPRVYMLLIAALAVAALAGVLAVPAYAGTASLTICKIAGTGVTTGTNFTFDAGGTTVSVPAGSCVTTGGFTVGTNVTVQETVPSGMQVSAISVGESAVLVSSNLAAGSAVVGIGGDHNTVSFTNSVPVVTSGCTFTQGYYKNHAAALPATMTLGSITYTRAQLVTILTTPVRGNGAISLAYQLIAAKANIAGGASAPAAVVTAITQADALLATTGNLLASGFLDPSLTSALTQILDQYNNGLAPGGPPHCD